LYEINKDQKQMETLVKKAGKYFQLKEQYREASIGLAYHRLEGFSTDLERIAEQENVQQERIKENVTKIEAHENQLRTLREDILAKEKNLATQQRSTQAYIDRKSTRLNSSHVKI